ncbi:MAG: ester cyclase [Chloroflexi bacterium]|nr:ester cyclase [Chloroflexota bacterium]
MSAEQNKEFVRRYFAALSGKDKTPGLVDEYVADSDPELKQHIAYAESAFPRYELIAEDVIAEGDRVVVRSFLRAVHKGEWMGIAATGKQVTMPFIIIYRIADGKIVQHWMQGDTVGLMRQLTGAAEAQPSSG